MILYHIIFIFILCFAVEAGFYGNYLKKYYNKYKPKPETTTIPIDKNKYKQNVDNPDLRKKIADIGYSLRRHKFTEIDRRIHVHEDASPKVSLRDHH